MNKLKTLAAQAAILTKAFLAAIIETILLMLGILLAGTIAMIVVPVVNWVCRGVLARAKLKMVNYKGEI